MSFSPDIDPSALSVAKLNRQTEPFIKGPLPLAWIQKACKVKASRMAYYLWYKKGILPAAKNIQLRPAELREFGIGEKLRQREADRLEEAGLIEVTRKPGAAHTVRIIS